MHESQVAGLARLHQGKVRDIYAIDEQHMLIVTTDRLSAFDVVLPDPIPGKGRVLTQISNHWFGRTGHIVPNHLSDFPLSRAVPDPAARALLADRSMIVRRLNALPVEAVVRGYLIGSGWKDYQRTGAVSGRVRRGRHTTVAAVMLPLERGGYLVDTPGFSEVGVWDIDPASLDQCFADFKPFLGECRYGDCRHQSEPGCRIREAVEQGAIAQGRWESYGALLAELESAPRQWE